MLIGNGFLVRDRHFCPFPPLSTRIMIGLNLCRSYACCPSPYEFICASLWLYLDDIFFLEAICLLCLLQSFHFLFSVASLALTSGFDKDSLFSPAYKEISLCVVQLWVSVLVSFPIYCKRKFL